jgi:hypothetical protein
MFFKKDKKETKKDEYLDDDVWWYCCKHGLALDKEDYSQWELDTLKAEAQKEKYEKHQKEFEILKNHFKNKERGGRRMEMVKVNQIEKYTAFKDLEVGDTFITSKGSDVVFMKIREATIGDNAIFNAVTLNAGDAAFFIDGESIIPVRSKCEWEIID